LNAFKTTETQFIKQGSDSSKQQEIHAVRASNLTADTNAAKVDRNIDFHPKHGDRDEILSDEDDILNRDDEV